MGEGVGKYPPATDNPTVRCRSKVPPYEMVNTKSCMANLPYIHTAPLGVHTMVPPHHSIKYPGGTILFGCETKWWVVQRSVFSYCCCGLIMLWVILCDYGMHIGKIGRIGGMILKITSPLWYRTYSFYLLEP